MVNGQRVPYIRNSRHEARGAARMLTEHTGFPVDTTGVIAVMGAHKGFTIKKQPEAGAVVVIQRKTNQPVPSYATAAAHRVPDRRDLRGRSSVHHLAVGTRVRPAPSPMGTGL